MSQVQDLAAQMAQLQAQMDAVKAIQEQEKQERISWLRSAISEYNRQIDEIQPEQEHQTPVAEGSVDAQDQSQGDSWGMKGGSAVINRFLSTLKPGTQISAKEILARTSNQPEARNSVSGVRDHLKSLGSGRNIHGKMQWVVKPVGSSYNEVVYVGVE